MDIPDTRPRQEYNDDIKVIEANIKDISSGTAPEELYAYTQTKLDKLASRFQYDDQLGIARYKLYELQALLYYFQKRDEDALAFMRQAIEVRGASYKRAEQLIEQIQSTPQRTTPTHEIQQLSEEKLTKEEKKKRLIGVDGWLAWYVVGLFIATIVTLVNLFSGGIGLSSSDVQSLNQYQPGLGYTLSTLTTFENVALVVDIALLIASIVLIFQRRKLAKVIAISCLAFGVIYTVTDYALVSSLFNSSGLAQYTQTELSQAASYAGRNVMGALIWIPYFIKSRRVRATLTR